MLRIGFLFNHDHVHQIPHAATVAFELSTMASGMEVLLITSSKPQFEYLQHLEAGFPLHKCIHRSISIPAWLKGVGYILDKALPVTRVTMLANNLGFFRSLDVLVVPEKTSLLLRNRFGLDKLKFVYTAHGAGDREIGFDRQLAGFDLIFLSGPKIAKRMRDAGLLATAESCIIGYPKFDAFHAFARTASRLFDNDRPVVLYNPHFSPSLSSWFSMGEKILDYFYHSDKYNLVFAPHVMLFKRRFHIATDSWSFGWTKSLAGRYRECPHMLIDTGSIACTDMTYTLGADIYLGDVSSQIWEFLVRPRPCLFANAHRAGWQDDPNYLHWHTGHVFEDIDTLHDSLQSAISMHSSYRDTQEQLFKYTFDIDSSQTSSHRAAMAILKYVNQVMPERI